MIARGLSVIEQLTLCKFSADMSQAITTVICSVSGLL